MHLEPKDVFFFFEEISKIPHGSGNTRQISNYLVEFAVQRNLEHYQDELGNVIIIKEASEGYENHEPVMLQGHMDMVAVKKPGCPLDMEKDGLVLSVEGDDLMAEGTSLGGDDGIAVAYGLALLDGKDYKHPRIEFVVTVDEEVGMDGARVLDVTSLKAKRLVNLDSEEEGIFLAGCAGGARVNLFCDYEMENKKGIPCVVRVSGLKGGHSGEEIQKERGNAICILGRVLVKLSGKMDFAIESLTGGVADNAIPTGAEARILITGYGNRNGYQKVMRDGFADQECLALLKFTCDKMERELSVELAEKDENIRIDTVYGKAGELHVLSGEKSLEVISLLNALPWGVQAMSSAMKGLVETSLNPGLLSLAEGRIHIGISVRSSIESAKEALIDRLKSIARLSGLDVEVTGEYPGWNYQKESPLREKMVEIYRKIYHREPKVRAIHAGVECGLLISKIPGLDCVSIGPDMKDIHTFEERLSISSTGRVWEYLLRLLENM